MLFGELVRYQGIVHKATSTYDDGTVDLDYNFKAIMSSAVSENEYLVLIATML